MNLTTERLIAAGVAPTQAKQFAEPLRAALALFDINTPARIAGFVSQAVHESTGFTRLEESLYYRSPERILQVFKRLRPIGLNGAVRLCKNPQGLANAAYANVNGNGDEDSGDGWRYRGRGLFQLTGRANYMHAANGLQQPYKDRPELVSEVSHACLTAAWFWHVRNCNQLADASHVEAITAAINPPKLGLAERKQLFQQAIGAFA